MMIAFFLNECTLQDSVRGMSTEGQYSEYFLFFPLFLHSINMLELNGFYATMLFAMVFQTFSIVIAFAQSPMVGEIFSSIAQVYLYNGLTKFTSTWFSAKFRIIATALILCSAELANYVIKWIALNLPDSVNLYDVLD